MSALESVYELVLPVHKQGDDLAFHLRRRNTTAKALEAQAKSYDEASRLCRALAAAVAHNPRLEVTGDTHSITVEGPKEALAELVEQGVLQCIIP